MARDRTQLNINIDPELLLHLKTEAIKKGQTLTKYVTEQLRSIPKVVEGNLLEQRLLRIEENLGLEKISSLQTKDIGTIFTNEGAKEYGEVAKQLFDSHAKSKGISTETALSQLAVHLSNYKDSNPELVFQILLGNHVLTGLEMTKAYRKGSCAMRTALTDWSKSSLDDLNEAFLGAVITKSLK